MVQAEYTTQDFSYDGAHDAAGLPARVAIFADRGTTRSQIAQDLTGAGFRCTQGGALADLLEGPLTLLGDVVMVDCPVIDAAGMAALSRLDMRVSRSGAQLIVATSLNALDDVFAALDQSHPQILVEPSRAERVVAVGRVLADVSNERVREMTEEDRIALLRLSQQVDAIAQQLDQISFADDSAPERLSDFSHSFRGKGETVSTGHGMARYPLPDPSIVRQIIASRQARSRFFDEELFADPAWDMLLDLTAAHAEHQRVSVTSLCIAAAVPATTALRWIKQLVETGVFERVADPADKRRAFIALSDQSLEGMARYFAEVDVPLAHAA
ncbi:winged helix DNA-binding protein [Erythrobacter crassostreae]|uniref:Winged helix DNA-binding protein n=1 Tax=Erythrobacter crassostreae TaxID=2828328 RepID=A0A9X1F415_9SPHN|nr:winged helix DNA-binding protein [Erythrobacter crassostrea]MBV7259384.1 winged helix DNA-binding protein [Erythrobacter crassostrea]